VRDQDAPGSFSLTTPLIKNSLSGKVKKEEQDLRGNRKEIGG